MFHSIVNTHALDFSSSIDSSSSLLSSNSNLNLNTSLDVDNDLLDNLGRSVQVDETLVDAHLEHVPGLGTLTVGGLTGGDLEVLGCCGDLLGLV